MSIRLIVTRGYGNGVFSGNIGKVVTRGYTIGDVVVSLIPSIDLNAIVADDIQLNAVLVESITLNAIVAKTIQLNATLK